MTPADLTICSVEARVSGPRQGDPGRTRGQTEARIPSGRERAKDYLGGCLCRVPSSAEAVRGAVVSTSRRDLRTPRVPTGSRPPTRRRRRRGRFRASHRRRQSCRVHHQVAFERPQETGFGLAHRVRVAPRRVLARFLATLLPSPSARSRQTGRGRPGGAIRRSLCTGRLPLPVLMELQLADGALRARRGGCARPLLEPIGPRHHAALA